MPTVQLQVLDLGAGTGLGTRGAAALGHTVIAVDSSEDMLSVLQMENEELPSSVSARISTVVGSAEHLPLEARSVDAIMCLQAWHWVNPALAILECDRVLRPQGMMGLAWHTWDRSNEWVQALAAIVEPDGMPADQTQSVPRELAGRGSFERKHFPFSYDMTVEQLLGLASSWSFVTERPDHDDVLARIHHLGSRAALAKTGLLSFPHITAAFRLNRSTEDPVTASKPL
ncbi:class I SAM-dependent methyltransferase [Arthrobacter psychrolactophilus]